MATIWSDRRVGELNEEPTKLSPEAVRSRFQQDYDRLLFSTPVRRLSDKTQVWPMDDNDGVRTRLTHSHEVANLARSIGSRIHNANATLFLEADLYHVIQPMLTAIGLAHDLGNPPFGHQGEAAIGRWFDQRKEWIFTNHAEGGRGLPTAIPDDLHAEFLKFDGNPQTLRLITKLQTNIAHLGLDLTSATLSAAIKYPVGAANRDKKNPIAKKYGYFEAERTLVERLRMETGLAERQRHPLTWIMEACDDIAYSVLDVDDAMKKGVISPDDVLASLRADKNTCEHAAVTKVQAKFEEVESAGRRPELARDIKIGYLRAFLIEALIDHASGTFVTAGEAIKAFSHQTPLMDDSDLCEKLKSLARQHAFGNPGVLRMEASGAEAIDGLMTAFWDAIHDRPAEDFDDILARRSGAKNKYVFALISQNYLEDASRAANASGIAASIRYRELRLLTDMLSGMTDTFTIKLWQELKGMH
ncbi:dGTPase [Alteripontixanthobacter maritimus]|uniref:dGTPase n=1 Tax=Alteripontixanthobacter maritimus TaxID=2161824 RepID=A0A369Q9D7_9SPHN|nr:dNTP triphosphohydrolase [Alteripontixanthobacter maritimus]RDC58898.1 dGTPase [Alteripontixanthobacter maritimus]RDC61408.1 dGTPase [Alteripontixanthobacter maritimus]